MHDESSSTATLSPSPSAARRARSGSVLTEAFDTDLEALAAARPERAAARFSYEVKQGGFRQLLYNLRGATETVGHGLVYAGASVAATYYGRALEACRAAPSEYHALVGGPWPPARGALSDALVVLTLEYYREVPVETEIAPLIARFFVHDLGVTALGELDGDTAAPLLREELASGAFRTHVAEALADILRRPDPESRRAFFDGISTLGPVELRPLHAVIARDEARLASLLMLPLSRASSEDAQLASHVASALETSAAAEVMALVRDAVTERYGDFQVQQPPGLWPHMPLYRVVQSAHAHPSEDVRALAAQVPGPWSWSPEELALAREVAAPEERDELARFA